MVPIQEEILDNSEKIHKAGQALTRHSKTERDKSFGGESVPTAAGH